MLGHDCGRKHRRGRRPVTERLKERSTAELVGVLWGLFASIEIAPERRVEFAQRGRAVVEELTRRLGIARKTRTKGVKVVGDEKS